MRAQRPEASLSRLPLSARFNKHTFETRIAAQAKQAGAPPPRQLSFFATKLAPRAMLGVQVLEHPSLPQSGFRTRRRYFSSNEARLQPRVSAGLPRAEA
jgi:hypothetical protein